MEKIFRDCLVKIDGPALSIENSAVKRALRFEDGFLFTEGVWDKRSGARWAVPSPGRHDFSYAGLLDDYEGKPLGMELVSAAARIIPEDIFSHGRAALSIVLREPVRNITVKRDLWIFPGVPVIRSALTVASPVIPNFYSRALPGSHSVTYRPAGNRTDSFSPAAGLNSGRAVSLFGRTDLSNDLVEEKNFKIDAGKSLKLDGNMLFLRSSEENGGVFWAQEAPPCGEKIRETDADFAVSADSAESLGWGILPDDIRNTEMTVRASALGVFRGDLPCGAVEFKRYFTARFRQPPANYKTMANPWGGGGDYWRENISVKFVSDEIRAAAEMGIEMYQLDDGWQECRSLAELVIRNRALSAEDWAVRKDVFPDGLAPVVKVCAESGVEPCLWFAPSCNQAYRNWRDEAELLLGFYERHGIKTFKIDAVTALSKEALDNLESLLRYLREKSGGEIYFNLDTTAGVRPGYLMFQEHGNIFLENRYQSEAGLRRYLPFKTLRSLWRLSEFIPAQRIQIEFPDIEKAAELKDNYKKTGYPEKFTQEYAAAAALFASPLCWSFTSAFSPEARKAVASVMALHKRIRPELADCVVVPVGDEPSGESWTGFLAHNFETGSGLLLVFRESAPENRAGIKLKPLRGAYVFSALWGDREEFSFKFQRNSEFSVRLERPNSFVLYRYKPL